MSRDGARRLSWVEPVALLAVALVGSLLVWGRLWVTAPASRGICGCGDPSLFQWFLAWPAHALTSGHSLVFSRDLFHPAGINLLSNTSVLALGVLLAPVTWLGGPVLTENVALLLAIPVAVVGMDLLLRRATPSVPVRVTCALLYGFSPYVVASLAVSHLMTAWIGILPLIALGAVDTVAEEPRRARRGQILLFAALVVQFFLSTELLLLSALVTLVVLVFAAVFALASRGLPEQLARAARRLALPLGAAALVLVAPAAYALWGPRSLKGNIWGAGFNPDTGGSSWQDLVRPHAVGGGLTALSGYTGGPVVQLQYVGWGLVLVTAGLAAWRWRDPVSRVAACTALVCLVLALSPLSVSGAPWQWLGRLPILQNVLQFRIVVFAWLAALVVVARGAGALLRHGRLGAGLAAAALAGVVLPVAIPVGASLPLRTVHVAVPQWWRAAHDGVVLAYPYPGRLLQAPLTWQAKGGFAVSMLGGSGPQATLSRAGPDAAATAVLDALSMKVRGRPVANAANAALVRDLVTRDGVTDVVVPVRLHGRPLVTGAPTPGAAVFFTEVFGLSPVVADGAWVFDTAGTLPAPHLIPRSAARTCARVARATPAAIGSCVLEAGPR